MFEEYRSIFDLKLPEILKSFSAENFASTGSVFGQTKRKVNLFESDFCNILWFDYSFEGFAEIFIRPKINRNVNREYYKNDIYYPIFQSGSMSSCGNVKKYSCENPWEKFVKNVNVSRRDDNVFLSDFGFEDCIFLKMSHDQKTIEDELNYRYRDVNKEVRKFHSLYKVKENGLEILTTYDNYHKYNLEVSSIDVDGNIIKYEILENCVYRDGGTTYRKLKSPDGKEHMFFTPSRLNENPPLPTFDNMIMIQINDENEIEDTLKFTNTLTLSK